MLVIGFIFIFLLALALANGANDVSKGVATLAGRDRLGGSRHGDTPSRVNHTRHHRVTIGRRYVLRTYFGSMG